MAEIFLDGEAAQGWRRTGKKVPSRMLHLGALRVIEELKAPVVAGA
jgi:hypothetical protein